MKPLTATCFDLDGTLIDTEPIHIKAESDCLLSFGIDINDSRRPRTFGLGIEPGMKSLAYALGLDFKSVLKTYLSLWDNHLHSDLRLLLGVEEALLWLLNHNIPIALVTSSDTNYVDLVESVVNLKQIFQVKITSDDVRCLKPSPTAYLEALKKLRVRPENCVGFEDSGAGITALNTAGLFSVAVHPQHESRPELHNAGLRVENLKKVQPKFESWFNR